MQYAEMAFTFKMWNRATKRKYGTSTINYVRGSPVQKKRGAETPLFAWIDLPLRVTSNGFGIIYVLFSLLSYWIVYLQNQ